MPVVLLEGLGGTKVIAIYAGAAVALALFIITPTIIISFIYKSYTGPTTTSTICVTAN